ncbi:MAG: hypothetical protein UHL07_06895 [Bacteroidaceae bacterium]|nr:hypothetical protein [Bacteroidaceae bacterium]
MNKKSYMCPGTQVADIDIKASLLDSSPVIKYDNTDGVTIDTEDEVFSREERGPWDTQW